MQQSRRQFLKILSYSGLFIGTSTLPIRILAAKDNYIKLTILHTNDVHSRMEPFSSGRHTGMGRYGKKRQH